MATKPDSDATWGASAPAAQMATKTQLDAFRAVGWPKRFTQTGGLMNRVLKELYQFVDWLAHGGEDAAIGAYADVDAGELFRLAPAGEAYAESNQAETVSSDQPTSIAVDAERFFVAYDAASAAGYIKAFALDDLGNASIVESWEVIGGLASGVKLDTNGTYLAAIEGTEWHVYNAATGASVYTGDHGAALADLVITDTHLVVVGTHASNVTGRIIDLSDGSSTNISWGTGLDAYCVAAIESDKFFIGAEADGSANEIGLLDSAGNITSRVNPTRALASGAQACSNGRAVFVHNGDTGGFLTAYSPADCSEGWELAVTAALPAIACDAKDVWLAVDDTGIMYAVDGQTGLKVRALPYDGTANITFRPSIACNGSHTLRGIYNTGPVTWVQSYNAGLGSRLWRRESGAPNFIQATTEVL